MSTDNDPLDWPKELDLRTTKAPIFVDRNRAALGAGWGVAVSFFELHYMALLRVGRAAGETPSSSDKALLLLGTHALNLFVHGLRAVQAGEFDIAPYLARPSYDVPCLIYACGLHEELAEAFLQGELKASKARKQVVEDLKAAGEEEEAEMLDKALTQDYDAAQALSHVSVHQAYRVLRTDGDATVPVVGGFEDAEQARDFAQTVISMEHQSLTWMHAAREQVLGPEWEESLHAAQTALRIWMSAT